MKNFSRYLEKGEIVFKVLYFLLAAGTFCPFIYDSSLQPMLVKLVLGLGMVLLLCKAVHWKSYIRMPGIWLFIFFTLSFLFSTVMNREYGMTENLKWLIWLIIQIGLLYACNLNRTEKSYQKEFHILAHVMLGYCLVASIVSIVQLALVYSVKWKTGAGELMMSGYHWGRLWGIYSDPNYGGVFHAVCIVLALYFFLQIKKWWRWFYALTGVLAYAYLLFSDSRTAEIGLYAGLILFTALYQLKQKKGTVKWKRMLTVVIIAALSAGIIFGGASVVKQKYYQYASPIIKARQTQQNVTNVQGQKSERQSNLEKDISNGRISLWQSGIEIWKTSPIYGTGYVTVVDYAKEHVKDTYAINNSQGTYNNLHNQFINVLVYQGVIGFVILLAAIVRIFTYIWKIFWKSEGEEGMYQSVLLCGVCIIGIAMLFLLEGFYTNSLGAMILWCFSGYLVHGVSQKKKEIKGHE